VYRKQQREQREFEDFHLSFGGRLSSDNRWVRLAKLIPWDQIEIPYAAKFRSRTAGPPALIARIAVGSPIIKEKLQLSDEDTVEQIRENPYLQHFLCYKTFTARSRSYCKERGIRLGGPPLGRPKKDPTRAERDQARDDERARIPIEGVFRRGKMRYSLSQIMTKRPDTSETTIALAFLVMNLDTLLRQLSFTLFRLLMRPFGYQP